MAKASRPVTDISNLKTRRIPARFFFNTAFKEFSLYDNIRSIPFLTDGLKPSQRKAIYGTHLRGENGNLMSVERLAAAVASVTDYHHGIGSLQSTLIGLANNYPGSNNMNIFLPEGQFGSRLTADAAAARYIETKLGPNFRALFPKADDAILEHHETDGEKIEPKTYMPLLPVSLINGASGTGTGHACLIMAYNPMEIAAACLTILNGKKLKHGALTPWYNGYHGSVERNPTTGQVVITGTLEVVNTTTIKITELPIGVFLDQYKAHLNKLEDAGFIKDYEDRSTEQGFDFTVTVPRSTSILPVDELYKKFKLISRDTENLTLWNTDGVLHRFDTVEEIIEAFIPWRLEQFEVRRQKLIADVTEQIRWMSEKLRFILFYLDHVNDFKGKKKDDLIALLLKNDFVDYERLLTMPMWNLTRDRIKELENDIATDNKRLSVLKSDTAMSMFKNELKIFIGELKS
jgi:DNA topoisomerase-2